MMVYASGEDEEIIDDVVSIWKRWAKQLILLVVANIPVLQIWY